MNDTICTISTSLGVGAISIIRISGDDAIKIANEIFDGKDLNLCESHTIHYGFIKEKENIIDEVLVSIMKAPKTYTKEDIVEINCHGGITTTNKILEILLSNGCRLAEPGEFTKRAFLNGRIDLIEAESIGDLINSETDKSRKMSINGLTGSLTEMIENFRKKLLEISANIEVNIDYPEYDDAIEITNDILLPKILDLNCEMDKILKESKNGKIIKNGLNVALVGKPNVGKSSILNALINEEKAIVTNIAGTTRDVVEGKMILSGIVLNISDTAGIRETSNLVEQIGVNKSKELINTSDLIIFVLNNNDVITNEELEILDTLKNKNVIIYVNKDDLENKLNLDSSYENVVYGNTKTNNGLDKLKNKIIELFNLEKLETNNYNCLSNARQIALAERAKKNLENCISSIKQGIEIDMLAIDIKECYDLLGELIGKTYKDELLDEIFKNFCLGK